MATIPDHEWSLRQHVVNEFGELMRGLRILQHASRDCQRPWFDLDLTMAQFRALMIIAGSGGSTGRHLAEALRIGPSAVTPLVDRLVQHGYVRREEDAEDRRITWIRPTEQGLEIFRRANAATREPLQHLLSELTPEELALVAKAFGVLRSAIDRRLESSHCNLPSRPQEEP